MNARTPLILTALFGVSIAFATPAGLYCSCPPTHGNGEGSMFLNSRPDYNGDGGFDFFDISAFLQDFSNGCVSTFRACVRYRKTWGSPCISKTV